MGGPALYDADILLWSEEQAALVRRLGRTQRGLPNEFDVENVAEEIESVGRSELAAVESLIELILLHVIKLSSEPASNAARHWRAEVLGFHGNARRRFAESMRQRVDLAALWRLARERAIVAADDPALSGVLPDACPFSLDEILAERMDTGAMVERLASMGEDLGREGGG
jgi:hypothetical protein